MELKIIMLSKISQAQKDKYHKFSFIVELRPKMMVAVMMMIMIIIIMGHEYTWETILGRSVMGRRKEKDTDR
jgi:hypothetical protein